MKSSVKFSLGKSGSVFDLFLVMSAALALIIVSGTVKPVLAQNGYGQQELTFENDAGIGNGHDMGKSGRRVGHSDNMPGQRLGHRKDATGQADNGNNGSGKGVSQSSSDSDQQGNFGWQRGFPGRGFRRPPARGFNPGQNNEGNQGQGENAQSGIGQSGNFAGQQGNFGWHRGNFGGQPGMQRRQGFNQRPFFRRGPGMSDSQRQPRPFVRKDGWQAGGFVPGNSGSNGIMPDQRAFKRQQGDNGLHLGWNKKHPRRNGLNFEGQAPQNNDAKSFGKVWNKGRKGNQKGNNGLHLGWRNKQAQGSGGNANGREKMNNGKASGRAKRANHK